MGGWKKYWGWSRKIIWHLTSKCFTTSPPPKISTTPLNKLLPPHPQIISYAYHPKNRHSIFQKIDTPTQNILLCHFLKYFDISKSFGHPAHQCLPPPPSKLFSLPNPKPSCHPTHNFFSTYLQHICTWHLLKNLQTVCMNQKFRIKLKPFLVLCTAVNNNQTKTAHLVSYHISW